MYNVVKSGTITVGFTYKIYNYGTEEEPQYDFDIFPMNDTLESDEWFPTIEDAEAHIRYRLSHG